MTYLVACMLSSKTLFFYDFSLYYNWNFSTIFWSFVYAPETNDECLVRQRSYMKTIFFSKRNKQHLTIACVTVGYTFKSIGSRTFGIQHHIFGYPLLSYNIFVTWTWAFSPIHSKAKHRTPLSFLVVHHSRLFTQTLHGRLVTFGNAHKR